ncbi:hypothetical protein [Nocardiopsis lucentensis]|uniref:hypothetical protein n=1 Tax=Nocardiopsis lucentensis TaxID=53441 RepID=UPI00034B6790|nr:hypothetical protein [Nocardiopsis lucentensis]
MRAFVLSTGRCGSLTVATACTHMTNYTAGHETRASRMQGRVDYPDQHVEVDNRLAWHLGELEDRFGDDAVYVHLARDPDAVAASYARRFHIRAGIMPAYASGIVRGKLPKTDRGRLLGARRYVDTVTANIHAFMAHKTTTCVIDIDDPVPGFRRLWGLLWAEGDIDAALAALKERHNAS